MLIGQLADQTGLSRDTIRYYEKYGLLEVEIRRENNYKEYSPENVRILNAVNRLKKHGYTLSEIKEYISLFRNQTVSCKATAPLIEHKLEVLDEKIAELEQIKIELKNALEKCKDHPNGQACRVLTDVFG